MTPAIRSCVAGILVVCGISIGSANQQKPPATQKPAGPSAPKPWPSAKELAERRKEAENRRLFRSAEPLTFTLIADFKAVQRDRNQTSTKTYPATLTVVNEDDTTTSIPLQIRTRGHSRRNPATCDFAPLRLEFPKDQTKGTVFDGHGELKLGTHCRTGAETYIIREYAAYRIYNLLTPHSFRARLAKATYVDSNTQKTVASRYGLFIEDDDDVARRMEGRVNDMQKLLFRQMDMETLTRMTVFEYMIGNTDVSIHAQHNVRIIDTQPGRRFVVPYDFDYAGLIDAAYAIPAKGLGIETVRDRLYRGPCRTAEEFAPFFEQMRSIKTDAMALFDDLPELSPSYRRDAKKYLDEFYRTIDRPGSVKKAFIDDCGKRAGM